MPKLRSADIDDAGEICRIYNHYVMNTSISFEETEVEPTEMARRITDVTQHLPWLVAENDGMIVGYAYATKWRVRSAYRFSVETSVYLAQEARGQGIGVLLYEGLLEELRSLGVHAVIGGIAQPNEASVRLHEKMGFRKVAMFEQVGFKNGNWVDVGYWQKLL
ncbi:arsinothricin resistance N-acetyltransferase ArsN1 family B [Undibacterium sp.]|uniref:arsinothricin resistance N-acetyltransferase ArsN1 family B n=1 Tax=Undibacterium sp. TaxID=1914977 RepID=UPI00374D0E04